MIDISSYRNADTPRKTVLAPALVTMTQFLIEKHREDLVWEINKLLLKPSVALTMGVTPIKSAIPSKYFRFKRFWYWRRNHNECIVDIMVRIASPQCQTTVYLSLLFFMWDKCSYEAIGLDVERPEREELELDEYLIPYLGWRNIEEHGEQFWHDYVPEVFGNADYLKAYVLAGRMKLRVEYRKLYKKNHIRSMLFFCEKTLVVESKEGCPQEVTIPAHTIVLNEKIIKRDHSGLDIYHECVHWEWHYMFFRLQEMYCTDLQTIRTTEVEKTNVEAEKAIWRIEWQAKQGSVRVMMPERIVRPWIVDKYAQAAGTCCHDGYRFQSIGFAIGKEHNIPYARVRGRMVQLGYAAAKGALNWVDGGYIEPFAFDHNQCVGRQTYVVDRGHVFELYKRDESFRELLKDGQYVFADGHICLNDEKYVRQTSKGAKLTPWANEHVDQCCLRFDHIWMADIEEEYELGCLYSSEEYNRLYFCYVDPDGIFEIVDNREKVKSITKAICGCNLAEALTYLMSHGARTYTSKELADASWVSAKTIERYMSEPRRSYDMDIIVALCIGRHLPPMLSYCLLDIARCSVGYDDYGFTYHFVLDALFMDSMEQVQDHLKEKKLPLLNVKDRYALA